MCKTGAWISLYAVRKGVGIVFSSGLCVFVQGGSSLLAIEAAMVCVHGRGLQLPRGVQTCGSDPKQISREGNAIPGCVLRRGPAEIVPGM